MLEAYYTQNDNCPLRALHQTVRHSMQQQWYAVLFSWSYATSTPTRPRSTAYTQHYARKF